MTISEAEKIARGFGLFFSNQKESLPVLSDGTTGEQFFENIGIAPYYSVWDLPHSPARTKYAFLYWADYEIKQGSMDFMPLNDPRWNDPRYKAGKDQLIGNVLKNSYGLLDHFVENAFKINEERAEIMAIQNKQKQDIAVIKFEARHKINFNMPEFLKLEVEFQNFLADMHDNWND